MCLRKSELCQRNSARSNSRILGFTHKTCGETKRRKLFVFAQQGFCSSASSHSEGQKQMLLWAYQLPDRKTFSENQILPITLQDLPFILKIQYLPHYSISEREKRKHLRLCSWWFLMNYWSLLVTSLPNYWPVRSRIWRTGVQVGTRNNNTKHPCLGIGKSKCITFNEHHLEGKFGGCGRCGVASNSVCWFCFGFKKS